MRLGTSVVQLSARTPTACAMASLTLDHLSGGRHLLGLGVSGPQVVEGWYGQRFPKPLARTREYIDIIRQVWAREERGEGRGDLRRMPADLLHATHGRHLQRVARRGVRAARRPPQPGGLR